MLVSVFVSAFDYLKIARAVLVILHNKCTHCVMSVSKLSMLAECLYSVSWLCVVAQSQVPSSIIFVNYMVQRCGLWQIKRMTSPDQDQVSMKSNMFGFRGYSQIKFYKTYKMAKNGLVWFGLARACISC